MAISRRKPFLVKFPIGKSLGRNGKPLLSDAFVLHSEQASREGEVDKREYGVVYDYDKVIVVNVNKLTDNIDKTTVFFIDEMPTRNNEFGDYEFVGKSDNIFGNYKIYLKKVVKNNYPEIYYLHHLGSICSFQLNYDKNEMVAYVPKERFVPFNHNNKIWTKKPVDENDDSNRISFVNKEIVGFTENSMSHLKITFEKYGEL